MFFQTRLGPDDPALFTISGGSLNDYIAKLDSIAEVHINKDPAQIVDSKVQAHDIEKILGQVKGPNVLEMGHGDGMWTERLIKEFGHSCIVDASRRLLDHARSRFSDRVRVFESLFEDFLPPDGLRFNTVVATHVLEHVDDPVQVLRCARNWLAPEGRILIIVPNATSIHRQLAVQMGIQGTVYDLSPRDHVVGHQRVYDLAALKRDAQLAGFDVIYERGFFLKILPNDMMTGFRDDLLKALVDISDALPAEWMANIGIVVTPTAAGNR